MQRFVKVPERVQPRGLRPKREGSVLVLDDERARHAMSIPIPEFDMISEVLHHLRLASAAYPSHLSIPARHYCVKTPPCYHKYPWLASDELREEARRRSKATRKASNGFSHDGNAPTRTYSATPARPPSTKDITCPHRDGGSVSNFDHGESPIPSSFTRTDTTQVERGSSPNSMTTSPRRRASISPCEAISTDLSMATLQQTRASGALLGRRTRRGGVRTGMLPKVKIRYVAALFLHSSMRQAPWDIISQE